jgi:hypothetical protein
LRSKSTAQPANLAAPSWHHSRERPPLARIDELRVEPAAANGYTALKSSKPAQAGAFLPVSPDVAICADCRRELFDPADRRYRYPFINCTNCGPRFSIIQDIPYDRPNTTMAGFTLCPDCRASMKTRATGAFMPSRSPARSAARRSGLRPAGSTWPEAKMPCKWPAWLQSRARSWRSRAWAAFTWPVMPPTRQAWLNCAAQEAQ